MENSTISIVRGSRSYYSLEEEYKLVSKALMLLGLDKENANTDSWNPFGEIISPGMVVLIKPNLVMDKNHIEENGTQCLYTQPEVVDPVVYYVLKALKGKGKIVIGDAPMQECDFDNLLKTSGYSELLKKYSSCGVDISLVDFRDLKSKVEKGIHKALISDYTTGTIVRLNEKSKFYSVEKDAEYRITNYDPRIMQRHHYGSTHEYYISNYVLEADVIINMPKPKSHRKAGATISLKNYVGINTRKEYLPHHTKGSKFEGGDEYLERNFVQKIQSNILDEKNIAVSEKKTFKAKFFSLCSIFCSKIVGSKVYSEGSWYGNNTISRTIVDLNRIVVYADKKGMIQDSPQRRTIIIADMIISGEKEGPVCPTPKNVGLIVAGFNPVVFDEVVATLMGFDVNKIPSISLAKKEYEALPLVSSNDFLIASNVPGLNNVNRISDISKFSLGFEPTSGWKNHIEL